MVCGGPAWPLGLALKGSTLEIWKTAVVLGELKERCYLFWEFPGCVVQGGCRVWGEPLASQTGYPHFAEVFGAVARGDVWLHCVFLQRHRVFGPQSYWQLKSILRPLLPGSLFSLLVVSREQGNIIPTLFQSNTVFSILPGPLQAASKFKVLFHAAGRQGRPHAIPKIHDERVLV